MPYLFDVAASYGIENVRSDAGTDFNIEQTISTSETLNVIDEVINDSTGKKRLLITYDGTTVWVSDSQVKRI